MIALIEPVLGLAGWHELALFVGATFVLNATPGVDLLLTVSRTLQSGARAGVAAALGINAGCVVHTLAAAFGLAAALAVAPSAFELIRWAGAAYLLGLGLALWRSAWRGGTDPTASAAAAAARPAWVDFRTGVITNVLNPKVALFFLAFLPQFIAPGHAHPTRAFLALGGLFVVQSTLFLLVLVALTARLRGLGARGPARRVLQVIGGSLFAALALKLLWSERPA